ncbi:MAG: hypothetical protein M1477_05455 [Candidatus Thermoplasmatota archaeon]|jgi:hypothetical protein|nr:hypothetical protein [Candidatus Thermoplasmatota archaeon]
MDYRDVGKIFIDSKGAGRLYIPKGMMERLPFINQEKVKLIFDTESGTLVIERL